jgi:hypothetical protein
MKRWIVGFWIGISLLGTAGCSHVQDYLEISQGRGMSREYLATLDKWTRSQIVYSEFETRAHISATYRSPEFKRAYLSEYTRIYRLREGERRTREQVLAEATGEETEFILYAYVPEKASNDFDRRSSIWSIFLVTGNGERLDPLEVRRIDPITPLNTEFFPYIHPYYGISYLLRFPPLKPRSAQEETMKLVFASVIAEVTLDFRTQ